MNKTDIKVLQEIIRNKDNHVPSLSAKLKKSPSMIYSSIKKAKPNIETYKKLFLTYPYDFSFLTKNNLKILFVLPNKFSEIIKQTKLSRFTINQLLRQLKQRGFLNKNNEILLPELQELVQTLKKYPKLINLPNDAAVIYQGKERDIILSESELPLKPTAFSAFDVNIQPLHLYYTTKTKLSVQEIFEDAKIISKDKRDKFITALYYYKHKNKLEKDPEYEELIKSKEFEVEHAQ